MLSGAVLAAPGDVGTLLYPEVIALWIARDVGLLSMGWLVLGNSGMTRILTDNGGDGSSTVKPSEISKANTVLQMSALSLAVLYLGLGDVLSPGGGGAAALKIGLETVAVASVFTTVGSAVGYVDGGAMKAGKGKVG